MESLRQNLTGYSPEVDIWMELENFEPIPLREVGPTFIVAFKSQQLPPCDATVVVSVDGKQFPRKIRLTHGMHPENPEAMILARDETSPF